MTEDELHRVFSPDDEGRAEAAAFCQFGTAGARFSLAKFPVDAAGASPHNLEELKLLECIWYLVSGFSDYTQYKVNRECLL